MRSYVVADWKRRRNRQRKLSVVEADTAEHAIVAVAGALPQEDQPGVYEAWPVEEPAHNLRITYEQPQHRQFPLRPQHR